ncbi:MAG: hypothetical protein AABX70_08245 [Nanoarchaeota archaeon]
MNTTISISKETRDKIKEFGSKAQSYDEIVLNLYKSAKERQLQDILFSEENTSEVKDALERAKKKWRV